MVKEEKLAGLFYIQNSKYALLAITENGKFARQYPVQLPRYYIHGIQIEPGKNHDLSCAGFYSPRPNLNAADGIFYFEIDNRSNEIRHKRFYEFEEWFLKDAMQQKSSKDPKMLYYFRIKQFILRNNGDFLLLAENQRDYTYDTYRNILAASIGPEGILKWKKLIIKRQHYDPEKYRNHASYCAFAPFNKNRVYLFFNDNPKNRQWPDEEKIHALDADGKSILKVIGIDPNGILSSSIVYEKAEDRMKTPLPLKYYIKLDDEILIPAVWWDEFIYFKIRINE
jgi:hypothetical protein